MIIRSPQLTVVVLDVEVDVGVGDGGVKGAGEEVTPVRGGYLVEVVAGAGSLCIAGIGTQLDGVARRCQYTLEHMLVDTLSVGWCA